MNVFNLIESLIRLLDTVLDPLFRRRTYNNRFSAA